MLPTFCVTVSPNFSQIDISVIEINSVLGIGVSLSIYELCLYLRCVMCPKFQGIFFRMVTSQNKQKGFALYCYHFSNLERCVKTL